LPAFSVLLNGLSAMEISTGHEGSGDHDSAETLFMSFNAPNVPFTDPDHPLVARGNFDCAVNSQSFPKRSDEELEFIWRLLEAGDALNVNFSLRSVKKLHPLASRTFC
jgi:hypothetical protein